MSEFQSVSQLFKQLPPEREQRIRAEAEQISAAIKLANLRKQQNLTQQQVATRIHTTQANVSKLESRADVQLSTLVQYVHALGARINIEAVLPDGSRVNLMDA